MTASPSRMRGLTNLRGNTQTGGRPGQVSLSSGTGQFHFPALRTFTGNFPECHAVTDERVEGRLLQLKTYVQKRGPIIKNRLQLGNMCVGSATANKMWVWLQDRPHWSTRIHPILNSDIAINSHVVINFSVDL